MATQKREYSKVDTGHKNDEIHTKDVDELDDQISYFGLYKFSTPKDKFLIIFGSLCSIAAGIASGLFSYAFGIAVGGIVTYAYEKNKNETKIYETEKKLTDTLTLFGILTCGLALVIFVTTYLATRLFNYTALNQIFRIREFYFSGLLKQDISWFDKNKTEDNNYLRSQWYDLQVLHEGIGEQASLFIFQLTIIITCLVQALFIGWELTLISLMPVPFLHTIVWYIGSTSSKLSKRETEGIENASMVAKESLTGIKTVVAFEGQAVEKKRYTQFLKFAMRNSIKSCLFEALGEATLNFFVYISCCLALWYGIRLVVEGRQSLNRYTTTKLVTIFNSVTVLSFAIAKIPPAIKKFTKATKAATNIFPLAETRVEIDPGLKLRKLRGKVQFENVSFGTKRNVRILEELNLLINPGETVALVGSSDDTKWTLIELLQRFYNPDLGNISIDGMKITDLNLTWLRNQIGVVNQEPELFNTTIRDNIRFGCLDASQYDIELATIKAGIHPFIISLPKGYDTLIEKDRPKLTKEQKQRIALARALVRNPKILLVEEASYSIESSANSIVESVWGSEDRERTTIIIAHTLPTIKNVDKIAVICDGKVVEYDSHEKLLERRGAYESLVGQYTKRAESFEKLASPEISENCEEWKHREISDGYETPSEENFKEQNEELNWKESFSIVWNTLKLSAPEKWLILLGSFNAIFVGSFYPLYGFLFGITLGGLALVDDDKTLAETNSQTMLFIIFGIATGVAIFLEVYALSVSGEKLTFRLKRLMFDVMIHQEVSWFDKPENGVDSLSAQLNEEAVNAQGAVAEKLAALLVACSTTVFVITMGFYFEYKLLLLGLVFSPLVVLSMFFEVKLLEEGNYVHCDSLERCNKLRIEAVDNIRTVKSLSLEKIYLEVYMTALQPYRKVVKERTHVRAIVYAISRSSLSLLYFVCLYYGGILMKHNDTDCVGVLGLTEIIAMTAWSAGETFALSPNCRNGLLSARRILSFINNSSRIKYNSNICEENLIAGNIEYKNVSFAYPTKQNVGVLDNFNMVVPEGKTVALVGSKKSGQSAVIQLLERFYDPKSGSIIFGEQDVHKIDTCALRMRLGLVSKDARLFCKTIGENIAYGDNTRTVGKEEIIDAALKADIHNFINSLPLGYETKLDQTGTQLSESQKRRVSIARALIRNPQVLLLDEAASSLDEEDEKIIEKVLNNAKEGKTSIIVAHKLKSIENADVIVVLNEGKVAEMGSHKELLSKKGLYWTLVNVQDEPR